MRIPNALTMTLCLFLPSILVAQNPKKTPTVGETFVILEARTELQQLGLAPSKRFVWVFINYVDAFKDANTIDYSVIDVPGIWAGLKPLARTEGDTVRFRITVPWYTSWFSSNTRKPTANGSTLFIPDGGDSS